MNLANALLRQLDHNFWADCTLADALIAQNALEGKPFDWFSHILSSGATWAARCVGEPSPYPIGGAIQVEDWKRAARQNYEALSSVVMENSEGLDRIIFYKNLAGVQKESPLWEILEHIMLHAQYHRGQINAKLREIGLEPARLDYIFFQWEDKQTEIPQLLA